MEKESNRELTFLDSLLKRNYRKISVSVYRKSTYANKCLHCSNKYQKSCKKSVVSSLFDRAFSIITIKDYLTEESARLKQVLTENGYQENINLSLSQSEQQTQATDIQEDGIKMSINLPCVEGISEKL